MYTGFKWTNKLFTNFIVLNKALLYLIKLNKTAEQSVLNLISFLMRKKIQKKNVQTTLWLVKYNTLNIHFYQ